jgi:hypothetical protein
MIRVAALYVDKLGPYFGRPDVDPWDKERDARLYDGPFPCVAHPPCGPWGHLAHLYEGEEQELGLRAVQQVRRFGGVLEHPARSMLWAAAGLPAPGDFPWIDPNGYSIEVEQVSWGHVARKRTWLYCVGVPFDLVRATIRRGGKPTHWASGGRRHDRKGSGGFAPDGIKICSAQQRRRTPPEFADWLVMLARSVEPARRTA